MAIRFLLDHEIATRTSQSPAFLGPSRAGGGNQSVEPSTHQSCVPPASSIFTPGGIEALYRSHAARLLRYFAGRGVREDADDLVQETFAKLAARQHLAETGVERPEAYLTTVATNVLRERARNSARQALNAQRYWRPEIDRVVDPQRMLEGREALRTMEHALAAMNTRRRRIFLLHRLERMTYAEIGEAVGMSEKGVKKQMAKALLELRRAIGESA